MSSVQTSLQMNFFEQCQQGKLSLITLVQKLPDENLINVPCLLSDQFGRHLQLEQTFDIPKKISQQKIEQHFNRKISLDDLLHQQSISVSQFISSENRLSQIVIKQRYKTIANQFKLSTYFIEKHYELAMKARVHIPPMLMQRIVRDAKQIIRLMLQFVNQDDDKLQRITKYLNQLETYEQLFDTYC